MYCSPTRSGCCTAWRGFSPAVSRCPTNRRGTRMWWNDLDAMAEALSTLAPRTDPSARVSPRATLQGAVRIGAGSRICDGAHVQGPVSIGRDCLIGNNALLRGPLCIGDGTRIGFASELKNARLGSQVSVGAARLVGPPRNGNRVFTPALRADASHTHHTTVGRS